MKKHIEVLVKEFGIEAACALTGKSRATQRCYYSDIGEHDDRFMPTVVVAKPEGFARLAHVTSTLADLRGMTMSYDADKRNAPSHGGNQDMVSLAQRFDMLMAE